MLKNNSLEQIYVKYFRDVYLFSLKLCKNKEMAEDITAETFLKAMKSLDKFRGDCSIRIWLCQIAKNIYFNTQRKNSQLTEMPEDTEYADDSDFVAMLADKDLALKIHKKLRELKEPYREIFYLRVFAELSFKSIGELFGNNEAWACTTYHRALDNLKEKIDGER